jgi:hypothetical protein
MSSINSRGQILHGVGGGQVSIDNVPFSQGAAGGWVNDDIVFFADGEDEWVTALYDVKTKNRQRAIVDPNNPYYGCGANTLFAGGGVWAGWLDGWGLYSSKDFNRSRAGLLGVGPDGAIGYKLLYHSDGPSIAREFDDDEWKITNGHASDLMLVGDRRAIWRESGIIHVLGIPQPQQLGNAWHPHIFLIEGRWWVSYFCMEAGVVLHPIGSFFGYTLSPAGVDCWHNGRVLADGTLRFALSSGEGEQPGQMRAMDIDFSIPVVNLAPPTVHNDAPPHNDAPHNDVPPSHNDVPPHNDVPQHNDVPPPIEEDDMLKAYGKVMEGFLPGTEIDNGNGTVSVQKPNGKFLCVTPEGSVEERDTPGGLWESFKKGKGCIIAERDGGESGPKVYVLSMAESLE